MRKTLGIRLLLAYNALFAWRRREEQEGGWLAHDWNDEAAGIAYSKWRHDETAHFLKRFPQIDFAGKTVLDFGSSHGGSVVFYAEQGAAKVIGVDIADWQIRLAERYLRHVDAEGRLPVEIRKGSHDRTPVDDASLDILMCWDVFEHILNPEQVLREWCRMLKPDGRAYVSFGPLWYHPHGVHLWECFPAPWTHVLFPERTVVAARHYLKRDDLDPTVITGYSDLGFNQMTVSRFLALLKRSGLTAELLHLCPVMGLAPLVWLPGVRELFVTEVHCILKRV
ncbi:MAG TPA: class I SAM-dependent methyltransferase [Planctomycetota bacterium]|nr:class I SAM-dependent methyltransferase [Planctomycetota bacterium]